MHNDPRPEPEASNLPNTVLEETAIVQRRLLVGFVKHAPVGHNAYHIIQPRLVVGARRLYNVRNIRAQRHLCFGEPQFAEISS
jgi:hypothetical protein